MKRNNNKYLYQLGNENKWIEISEEIAHEILLMDRMENASERRKRYHGAIFSLDRDDGVIGYGNISSGELNPEERLILKEIKEVLSICIDKLSKTQKRRIILHFFRNMSIMEIARLENVSWTAVDLSIKKALNNIKEYYEKFYEGIN